MTPEVLVLVGEGVLVWDEVVPPWVAVWVAVAVWVGVGVGEAVRVGRCVGVGVGVGDGFAWP